MSDGGALLSVSELAVSYGDYQVIWDVSRGVGEGEIVALLGPNGSGKSTILNSVAGLVRPRSGAIQFQGRRLESVPAHGRVDTGLTLVLERHRLFPYLTVRENLMLGAFRGEAKRRRQETLRWVEELFPIVRSRASQAARTLSGGEQQMVAIARGLMSRPRLLMVDEPTLGLTPRMVEEVVRLLREINSRQGVAVLFVEQNVQLALGLAARGYVLESGRLLVHGESKQLLESPEVRRVFLGMA
jgi:branched-chain amino acid transport system ATP-binding protein